MIEIGKTKTMKVIRKPDFGYYLDSETGNTSDDIFLPKNSIDRVLKIGDEVEVFIYKDSEDRVIATTKKPLAMSQELAYLQVVSKTQFGAFANFGLERDIFIPLKEQNYNLLENKKYLLFVYVDKTSRLAATTFVEDYLEITDEYKIGDHVKGICYGIQNCGNALIAVENKYKGIILKKEYYTDILPGDEIELRIKKYHDDGRISLTPRETARDEKQKLEETILEYLKQHDGFMPYNDKSSPEDIQKIFSSSKRYFKEALGGLMKNNIITQNEKGTYLKE